MREDRALQPAQCRRRLDTELVPQRLPHPPVDLERLRLPTRSVEREHQLRAQPLSRRVLHRELVELTDDLGVTAEVEVRIDPQLERRKLDLVQPLD